jgi:hypothetical protein
MNEQTKDTLQDQIIKILLAEGLGEGLTNRRWRPAASRPTSARQRHAFPRLASRKRRPTRRL